MPLVKACRRCSLVKPLTDFHVNRRSTDGVTSYCAACKAIMRHEWFESHQQQVLAKGRKFYEKNREKVLARRRELYHLRKQQGDGNGQAS